MEKHTITLVLRMLFTILLAMVASIFAVHGYWWFAAVACFFAIWQFISVLRRTTRSVKDMKRLIEAIRFNEMNISFRPAVRKGLPEELAQIMEESIAQFRRRLMQTETEQMFYDMLLQRIDSGIMVLNKYGDIEWINKTAVDMFGRPHPRKINDLSSDVSAVLNELVPREVKLLTINNIRIAVAATYFFVGGKDLKIISFKNIQSALEEHESDAWRKLISVLTHEMMNSITPILSLSETLSEETATNSENRQAIMLRAMQTIHRRSKGLIDFVKNYRQLTRIPEPVPVSIPVWEMLTDIHHLMKAEGIDFSYHIQPDDIHLFADRTQIEQLLINLIKNAWDACSDSPHPNIEIDVRKNEYQKPVIMISDNGFGIMPEVMDKIFVPFFTTKTGGSGIGLTICRQIMNRNHGSITIESEVDQGTKVVLKF
jgi:nitrogen fixation/metabolism regulation signal transduction histidine kinase